MTGQAREPRSKEQDPECVARVAELTRELDQLIYAVSHDLVAPLRAIDGFGLILEEDHAGQLDAEGLDCLRRIRAAGRRIEALLGALLRMSRQTRGEIQVSVCDLSAMAGEVVEDLHRQFPDHRVAVTIQPGVRGDWDPIMVRTLLEQLLDNAWKFTSPVPEARIEFRESNEDGRQGFLVRDNGVGFDMAYARERLFGVFQRMHEDRDFPGLGTGLATARRIVNRHGGCIRAVSAPGQGTTVYVVQGRCAASRTIHPSSRGK